ncbi:alpha/beta hydrolase [Sphingopyxis sp. 113P3]|uniref:alpha/beta hydrolase n=1 Tax=Sphingopyxis sp. (strain 113P3) TaxID=292913 RepID=UPI0006AD1CB1|nr:alpha/beta hydrolase [Sphingopyxis sp. 113P3]ALC14142.1 hormone-sensitive lipase [Sphingopyxis sp. 113P3]
MALPGNGYPPCPEVVTQQIELGPLHCLSCAAPNAHGVLFHIHGGGFRGGNPSRSRPFAETVAARLGCTVILPSYPLAPENPFPAALIKLRAAVAAIETNQPLVIGGDSAGGNLALGLWHLGAAADALWLLSPWLDLRIAAGSYDRAAATDQLFSREMALDAREMYLQGHSPGDPLASPLLGSLEGLPETFVLAGGGEVLLDDTLKLFSLLGAAGVDVECRIVPDMQHVAPTFGPDLPGSAAGLDAGVRFLERQFARR